MAVAGFRSGSADCSTARITAGAVVAPAGCDPGIMSGSHSSQKPELANERVIGNGSFGIVFQVRSIQRSP